jgi:YVTN family beta-propeller protein
MVGDTAGGYGYGRVRAVIQLGTAPGSLALSKDGQVLYVVLPDGNSVAAIRTSDYRVATEIPVGADPAAIAVSPDSAFVYVANWMDQDVSVISTADNTVQRRIQVGFCPSALAVCAGGTRLFVGGLDTEYAEVIALPEDTVVAWVEVPAGVRKMATDISEWGVFDWVLVATNGFDVLRLDGTSGQVMKAYHLDGYVATVDAGQYSSNIGWWAAGQSLDGEPFLASLGSSNVFFTMRRGCFSDMDERCVLDALNRWLVLFYDDYPQEPGGSPGTIVPLGTSPEHVVVAGRQAYNAGYIYVTDPVDRTLTVIR